MRKRLCPSPLGIRRRLSCVGQLKYGKVLIAGSLRISPWSEVTCSFPYDTTRIENYGQALPKTPEWESDNVHFVPPPDWESKNMPRPIKQYMEYEWSLSTYTNECGEGNPLKIVPVYFWPGDQVDLPCLMCELAFVFNGKMKMWGKATNILKFLENPKRTARFSSKYWSRISNNEKLFAFSSKNATEKEIVDWMPAVTDKNGISVNLPKKEPVYIQRNGKLSIIRVP
ncbi:hypothetical protein ANCCEY_07394 [Ancylostoma ceylanicum]|uniref:Uncharacterized protein n=1 Tax=Ancylostoma ceylanicum TaxID=53326 RepID=A0A0D6LNU1_9BILA|nr:hypothetical protein ANCCEY_07394 [Ancylostoma ceylanicum]